jgi:hypothetical protein
MLSMLGVVIFSPVIAAIRSFIVVPNLAIIYLLPLLFAAVSWGWRAGTIRGEWPGRREV